MSYAVWGAFNSFRENTVDLRATDTDTARASRQHLFEQLTRLAKNDPSFPLVSSNYQPFGSFARRTKIRPLDDIDVMIILNGRGTISVQSQNDPYNWWLQIQDANAPLACFPDNYGYVDSTKVLNKIKLTLASVPNYSKAELKRNMQAVVLDLASYPWSFDIVPGVAVVDSNGQTSYYLIPNGRGDWIRTDPRIDAANVTRANQQHGGEFLPTVRLLKYWNRRVHKPVLPSYYFETMCLNVFELMYSYSGYPKRVKLFFDNCPSYLASSCSDPKRLGPNLDASISLEIKQKVAHAMSEASTCAGYALMYENMDDTKNAIYWWRRVFGQEFPDYG